MGLLDRRPGYYRAKIALTILAFFAGWVLFVIVGNSWTALAVAPLVGVLFTQLSFIGHRRAQPTGPIARMGGLPDGLARLAAIPAGEP